MKKVISYICMLTWVVIVLASCKDDDNGIPARVDFLLSSIKEDGTLIYGLAYDDEKQLTQVTAYHSDGTPFYYDEIDYNSDGITERRRYNEDDALQFKTVFVLDKLGQIIRDESYVSEDIDELAYVRTYSYDQSGRVENIKFQLAGDPIYLESVYTYDAVGRLTKAKFIRNPGQLNEFVRQEFNYAPGTTPFPDHWNDYFVLFLRVDLLDMHVLEIYNITVFRSDWDSKGVLEAESRTDASKQEYNTDGYLIRQVLTRVSLSGLSPKDSREMTYEYTK